MNIARTLVIGLALLAATACKKDKGEGAGGAGGQAAGGAAGGGAAARGPVGNAMALLPKDSDVVLGVNLPKITESALWKKYEAQFMAKVTEEMAELKEACGTDLMAKLGSIHVGLKGEEADDATIVVSGIDKGTLTTCMNKAAEKAKAEGKNVTITVDGNYIEGKKEGDAEGPFSLLYTDDSTFIIAKRGKGSAARADLEAIAKGGNGVSTSPAFMEMIGKAGTGEAIWFAMNGNAKMFQQAESMGYKFQAVYGSLGITDGLSGKFFMRMESAEKATELTTMAKQQIEQMKGQPMVGAFLTKVTVEASGPDVKMGFALDAQQLNMIAQMAGSFMP